MLIPRSLLWLGMLLGAVACAGPPHAGDQGAPVAAGPPVPYDNLGTHREGG